jgi:hypothetical protein
MRLLVPTDRGDTGARNIGSNLPVHSGWGRLVAALGIAVTLAGLHLVASPELVAASDPCVNQPNSLMAPATVSPGTWLCSNEEGVAGGNQAYGLLFQPDCNLVLYTGRNAPLWSSGTSGRSCTTSNSCLAMQGDGNLVIYWPNGCGHQPALWTSGTGGHSGGNYCIVMQADGNVVIYTPSLPCGNGASYLTGANSPTWTQSSNTRPFEGADSWRTPPVTAEGRNTCLPPCKTTNVYFRAIDQYSARRPSWNSAIQAAVSAWNQSPAYYSFTPRSSDTYNFIDATYPGDTMFGNCGSTLSQYSGPEGVTVDYDRLGTPSSNAEAKTIYWTDVCLNENALPSSGGALVQNAAAHELGHTIGLAHNVRDLNSLMNPNVFNVFAPDSNDIGGPAPGCPKQGNGYAGLGGGTMCIYGWGD